MQWQHVHIRDEDQGVTVWLPNGESVEITFDGSDPRVFLRDMSGDAFEMIPEGEQ